LSSDISSSTKEQATVANTVMVNMSVMINSVEATRLNIQEVEGIVEKLTSFSESLQHTTSQFKLG